MATLTGIISKLNGSAGNLTFKRTGGQTVVSEKVTSTTNRRTSAQQKQRMKWANIVAMYKGVAPLLNMAFENKTSGVSDYNMFMKINLQNTPVYLTKSEVAANACVAAPYQITQGSLPSIIISGDAGESVTDIALGSLAISASTTVKEFSNAVVENNDNYSYGDQIAFIYCVQTKDAVTGAPKCEFYGESIVLDKNSEVALLDSVSNRGFSVSGGYLALGSDWGETAGAYAWVHSRKSSGKTLVSTQILICDNETVYSEYTGTDAYQRAVETYGGENSTFLTPTEQTESATKYTLTLSVDNESNGSLDPSVGTHEYAAGTQVVITATGKDGHSFDCWNDGTDDNPRTVTMTGNMTLKALFE